MQLSAPAKRSRFCPAVVYLLSVAMLLALTAGAKLLSATGEAPILALSDPILRLTNRAVLIGVGLLELAVAVYVVVGQSRLHKHLVLVWLSTNFIAYRAAIWWLAPGHPCLCLGTLDDKLAGMKGVLDWGLGTLVATMFFGSLSFLLLPHATIAWCGLDQRWRSRIKWLAVLVGSLLLAPPLQVGFAGLHQPGTTGPILLRRLDGRLTGAAQPGARLIWRSLEEVPPDFLKAVLAAEDEHFFDHHGFDWAKLRSALNQAAAEGRTPRGGTSTMTQQCARSLFLWQGRSWARKALEAYYTVWMEVLLSKQRILELYVNVAEFGEGVYGVEAGAQYRFGIPARHLTRDRAVQLASVLPSPKKWDLKAPSERLRQHQANISRRIELVRLPWESTPEKPPLPDGE